jgi:2-polyprenyl-6-methoxyphenol hydroxylase-like FAD-dependent oxidoreductase
LNTTIVIGGSMAGMLAARALSETFDRVTILERDFISGNLEGRRGVPQARHLHALLPRGRRILERWFPGITSEFQAAGAEILDVANDIGWLTPQGWGVRFPSKFEALTLTRDLLDWVVRRRLLQLPNVELLHACEVTSLRGRANLVEGVNMNFRAENGMGARTDFLRSEFVVVATGRNSSVPNWLRELDLPGPETSRVDAHVGYASRMFRRPSQSQSAWRALFIQAAPPAEKRAGILFPVEGNRWLVTLQGGDGDYPPADETGFLEFARTLRSPLLFEAIKYAEPLTPISSYRATQNRLQHYERLKSWPDRLIVLGDAACAFNPVYGQGITTAALAAEDLQRRFRQSCGKLDGVARHFQRQLAKINRAPWMLATSEDLRYAGVEGAAASPAVNFMHKYMNNVLRSATRSKTVRRRFLEVQGMLKGPAAILRPFVVAQVLKEALKPKPSSGRYHAALPGAHKISALDGRESA